MKWDNRLFQGIGKLIDLYLISLLWLVFCLPIVTAGASTSAMYYTVHKVIRGNRGYMWESFWTQFKDHLGDSIKTSLIVEAILAVLGMDIYVMQRLIDQDAGNAVFLFCFYILVALVIIWWVWIFAYRARFQQTVKGSLKNGLLLLFVHLPKTGLLFLIVLAQVLLAIIVWDYYLAWVPILPLMPASACILLDLILEPVFRKYMTEEELAQEEEYDREKKELNQR